MANKEPRVPDTNGAKALEQKIHELPVVGSNKNVVVEVKHLVGVKYFALWSQSYLTHIQCIISLSIEIMMALLQIGLQPIFVYDGHNMVIDFSCLGSLHVNQSSG